MTDFKNEFSWSKFRDTVFNECKRKYFFNYYGYWNGWISTEEKRIKQIYYLKKLTIQEIWLGIKIHEIIELVLKKFKESNIILSLEKAKEIFIYQINTDFRQSELKSFTGFNSKMFKLFEHEYNIPFNIDDKNLLIRKGAKALENFYSSEIYKEIIKTPKNNWLSIEEFLHFYFQDTKIFLSMDLALKTSNNHVTVYDWKTGKNSNKKNNDLQLTLYALYIKENYNIPIENITAKIFNLTTNEIDEIKITEEKIENIKSYINKSIKEMKDHLIDTQENTTIEDNFIKTQTENCSRCNFQKVCFGEWKKN